MLMVLLAGCGPTRPYTAQEQALADRYELPPPRTNIREVNPHFIPEKRTVPPPEKGRM